MSVIRYEPRYRPISLVSRLHSDLDQLFPGLGQAQETMTDWLPAVDIREDEQRFVLHVDAPGVKAGDIEVTMENGVLSIQGRRETVTQDEQQGYHRTERVSGSFLRRFSLPDTADNHNIDAKTVNGVLEIVIPKQERSKPRRISVKTS